MLSHERSHLQYYNNELYAYRLYLIYHKCRPRLGYILCKKTDATYGSTCDVYHVTKRCNAIGQRRKSFGNFFKILDALKFEKLCFRNFCFRNNA